MYLYKFRTWIANFTADNAAKYALEWASRSGEMLADIDVALSYIKNGEINDGQRVLQECLNKHGHACADNLDNYETAITETPLLIEQEDIDIISPYPPHFVPDENTLRNAWWPTEGTDPRD